MDYKARKIKLQAKKQVFSGMLGSNSSLFKGQGFDFMELREYQDGDDVKHIDWIATAKKNKPFVKIFHEQRQLNIAILPLLSGSLHFGTTRLKSELLTHIYAILAFVALKNGEKCQKILHHQPQKITNHYEIEEDIKYLLNYEYINKEVDLKDYENIKLSKLLLFILGDFVGDFDLSKLAKKHDVVAIIIRDRFEENPSDLGYIDAIDPTTGGKRELYFSSEFCNEYKKTILENDKKLYTHFKRHRVRYQKIYTDENPYKKLLILNRS